MNRREWFLDRKQGQIDADTQRGNQQSQRNSSLAPAVVGFCRATMHSCRCEVRAAPGQLNTQLLGFTSVHALES